MSINQPNRDFDHGYAIIRYDYFNDISPENVFNSVTVKGCMGFRGG